MANVTFFIEPQSFPTTTVTADQLSQDTFISLTFNEQKNSIKGGGMGHGRSCHPIACPVRITASLTFSLRNAGATLDAPLAVVPHSSKWQWTWSAKITTALRLVARDVNPKLVLRREDISARVMRASGAMALLLGGIDYEKIKLLVRQRSIQMMTYLHTSDHPLPQNFYAIMVDHGEYAKSPNPYHFSFICSLSEEQGGGGWELPGGLAQGSG